MRKHLFIGVAANGRIYLDLFRDSFDGHPAISPLIILPDWYAFLALMTNAHMAQGLARRNILTWQIYAIERIDTRVDRLYTHVTQPRVIH